MPADRNIDKMKVGIYASEVLECAGSDNERIFDLDGQLRQIVFLCYGSETASSTFDDMTIDAEDREKLVQASFSGFDQDLVAVLKVMVSRGDYELLPRVRDEYTRLAEEKLGSVIVDVTTVVELDDRLRGVISDKLSSDFGQPVILRENIDHSIVGGIIMSAHGQRIDASIQTRLEEARIALSTSPDGDEV
ncbi:MAG: ATP synthase F1 subunit delta [Coriobacteriales bacterium]|jgi:F-type H+-transporting ATPase subunit delta